MAKARIRLTGAERDELRQRLRSRTLVAEQVRQARLLLMLAEGKSYGAIRQALGCNANYISRWKGRFIAERLGGMYSSGPSGEQTHPGAGGENSRCNAPAATRRLHPLE